MLGVDGEVLGRRATAEMNHMLYSARCVVPSSKAVGEPVDSKCDFQCALTYVEKLQSNESRKSDDEFVTNEILHP